jgi:hypothetical protein
MNRKIIVFVIVFLIISFGLGIFTGYGPIPDLVQEKLGMKLQNPEKSFDSFYYETDFSPLININSIDDIPKLRSNLIYFIMNENDLSYSKLPLKIDIDIQDKNFHDLENLKQIDKFSILMDYDVNSISYLFLSENSNDELIIYHQGHSGGFIHGKKTIQFFLNEGYSVLAFSMPLLGMNNQPIVDTEFGKIKLISHDYFQFIESTNFSPLKFYFEPITLSLNYIESNYDFINFHMIGISGGGWTTTVYSAIDERISKSFSIAGSVPLFLRTSLNDLGDYEQILPNFYKIGNYFDLYILASYGDDRKHIQIFNKNDPCCFSGDLRGIFDDDIQLILEQLGNGNYALYLDETHAEHKISDYSLDIILNEIKKPNI